MALQWTRRWAMVLPDRHLAQVRAAGCPRHSRSLPKTFVAREPETGQVLFTSQRIGGMETIGTPDGRIDATIQHVGLDRHYVGADAKTEMIVRFDDVTNSHVVHDGNNLMQGRIEPTMTGGFRLCDVNGTVRTPRRGSEYIHREGGRRFRALARFDVGMPPEQMFRAFLMKSGE